MKDSGKVEVAMSKETKAGKPYMTYQIGGVWINCFDSNFFGFKEGENVIFEYESKGDFKNVLSMELLAPTSSPANGSGGGADSSASVIVHDEFVSRKDGEVNPAFFGMIFNKAVDTCIAKYAKTDDLELLVNAVDIEVHFNWLWDLAVKLKKEKGVK